MPTLCENKKEENPSSGNDDFPISKENSEKIYKKFLENQLYCNSKKCNFKTKIISIVGSWGTGKSTIVRHLYNKLPDEDLSKCHIVQYNALEFEDKSQVTSELYNNIAKAKNLCRFNRNKFQAIAELKKESNARSIAISQVLTLIIFGLAGIVLNRLFNHYSIYFILISLCLSIIHRDALVTFFAGFKPRKSHIDILKSIDLHGKSLVILVDEIDRLSPESTKLLFDEILAIKHNSGKNRIKIFLFYDDNVVLHNYKLLNIKDPHIFLQKFYDEQYRLSRVYFIYEMQKWAIDFNQKQSNHNSARFPPVKIAPSNKILEKISDNLSSFRETNNLKQFFDENSKNEINYRNETSKNIDLFWLSLSLRFFFNIDQIDNSPDMVYSNYLNDCMEIINQQYIADKVPSIKNIDGSYNAISKNLTFLLKTPYKDPSIKFLEPLKKITLFKESEGLLWLYVKQVSFNINYINHWSRYWLDSKFKEEFQEFLDNTKWSFPELIKKLSEELSASMTLVINNKDYSIETIQDAYKIRKDCLRCYLSLYFIDLSSKDNKLENHFEEFKNLVNTLIETPLDSLLLCTLLDESYELSFGFYNETYIKAIGSTIMEKVKPIFIDDKFEKSITVEKILEVFSSSSYLPEAIYRISKLFIYDNKNLLNDIFNNFIFEQQDFEKYGTLIYYYAIFGENLLNIKFGNYTPENIQEYLEIQVPELNPILQNNIKKSFPNDPQMLIICPKFANFNMNQYANHILNNINQGDWSIKSATRLFSCDNSDKNLLEIQKFLKYNDLDLVKLIQEISYVLYKNMEYLLSNNESSLKSMEEYYNKSLHCISFYLYLYLNSYPENINKRTEEISKVFLLEKYPIIFDDLILCVLIGGGTSSYKVYFSSFNGYNTPMGKLLQTILSFLKQNLIKINSLPELSNLFNSYSLYFIENFILIKTILAEYKFEARELFEQIENDLRNKKIANDKFIKNIIFYNAILDINPFNINFKDYKLTDFYPNTQEFENLNPQLQQKIKEILS